MVADVDVAVEGLTVSVEDWTAETDEAGMAALLGAPEVSPDDAVTVTRPCP